MRGPLEGFGADRLEALLRSFPGLRAGVLGDFFLDKHLEVEASLAEPSLETGRTAHQVVSVRHAPGAAGTVARNLASLGAGSVLALGFTGEDGEGWELRRDLEGLGVDARGLLSSAELLTPTYLKPRERGLPGLRGEHSRYDCKNRRPLPPGLAEGILGALDRALPSLDLLLVMDQVEEEGAGALCPAVLEGLLDRISRLPRLLVWADSRRRIRSFRARGAPGRPGLVLKMNQFELASRAAPGGALPEAELLALAREAEAETGASVFVTAAERGAYLRGPGGFLRVPALALDGETDPTGAGDAFSAAAALALAAGASGPEAALLGNLAASLTVRVLGDTGEARPEALARALADWEEQNP